MCLIKYNKNCMFQKHVYMQHTTYTINLKLTFWFHFLYWYTSKSIYFRNSKILYAKNYSMKSVPLVEDFIVFSSWGYDV